MGAAEPARPVQVGSRTLNKGKRRAQPEALFPAQDALVVRVLTDVAGIDKEFDYRVPEGLDAPPVGTEVRIDLSGRRVGGWVTATAVAPQADLALKPFSKVRGHGPEPSTVDLAGWAAWRWYAHRVSFLRAAAADFAVTRLPSPQLRRPTPPPATGLDPGPVDPARGPVLVRLPPAADPTALVAEVAQAGPTLVVVPSAGRAATLADRLRAAGGQVACLPGDWAQARAGAAVVVGARSAAWGPCPGLSAVIVLDGHDEGLWQEGSPTWNAVDVAVERARRAGCLCLIVSPCPTPELLAKTAAPIVLPDRTRERRGWAGVEVLDRRGDDPRLGLYSERLVRVVRDEAKVLCILNRTGRSRLLACGACGELSRCQHCGRPMATVKDAGLGCPSCGESRPELCLICGSISLKVLRIGVSRARQDLETLAGRTAVELSAASPGPATSELTVGTEAALHRFSPADGLSTVAFVDFDQELLAPRVRAAAEALALLALASRLVKGRRGKVLVQTRLPDHPAVRAAVAADPEILSTAETLIREQLDLPPFRSLALLHGPAAGELAESLRPTGVSLLGPDDGTWLVKAASTDSLCDALASVGRPTGKVRVAVDPGRL